MSSRHSILSRINVTDGDAIPKGLVALFDAIQEFLHKRVELERLCRVAVLLHHSGVEKNNWVFKRLADRCVQEQKGDGGFLGVTDTMWCTSFLSNYEKYYSSVKSAISWLDRQKHDDGGWGRNRRDMGRIPVTGLMLYFLPPLASSSSLKWLEKEWVQECDIDPGLTYKGAFTLMA